MFYFSRVLFTIFLLIFTTQAFEIPKDHYVRDTLFNTKGAIIRFKEVTLVDNQVSVVLVARLEKEKKYIQLCPKVKIDWKHDDLNRVSVGEYILSVKLAERKLEERFENNIQVPFKFIKTEKKLKVRENREIYEVDVTKWERPDGSIYKQIVEKKPIPCAVLDKTDKKDVDKYGFPLNSAQRIPLDSVFKAPASNPLEAIFKQKSRFSQKKDPLQQPPVKTGSTPQGTPNSKPSAPPRAQANLNHLFESSSDSE